MKLTDWSQGIGRLFLYYLKHRLFGVYSTKDEGNLDFEGEKYQFVTFYFPADLSEPKLEEVLIF